MKDPYRKPAGRHRDRAEYDFEDRLLHMFLRENPDTELRCTECGLTPDVNPPLLVWMTGRLVCYNCECTLILAFETDLGTKASRNRSDRYQDKPCPQPADG